MNVHVSCSCTHFFLILFSGRLFWPLLMSLFFYFGHPAHSDMVLDIYLSITQKFLYVSYMRASCMKSFHPLPGLKYPPCWKRADNPAKTAEPFLSSKRHFNGGEDLATKKFCILYLWEIRTLNQYTRCPASLPL